MNERIINKLTLLSFTRNLFRLNDLIIFKFIAQRTLKASKFPNGNYQCIRKYQPIHSYNRRFNFIFVE